LEINPDYVDAWVNKGVVLYALDKKDEAINAIDKALELDPEHTDAWFYKGVALYKLGKLEESKKCYDKAYELQKNSK